jgi:hypothetical protein
VRECRPPLNAQVACCRILKHAQTPLHTPLMHLSPLVRLLPSLHAVLSGRNIDVQLPATVCSSGGSVWQRLPGKSVVTSYFVSDFPQSDIAHHASCYKTVHANHSSHFQNCATSHWSRCVFENIGANATTLHQLYQ